MFSNSLLSFSVSRLTSHLARSCSVLSTQYSVLSYRLTSHFLLLTFFLLLLSASVYAADASITATVDKNQASLEDYIILTLAIEGTRDEPSLPGIPDFKVQSRGSSSQMTFINGKMSSKVSYTYILFPQKKGSFTLGPFTVEVRGKIITSNPITVRIEDSRPQEQENSDIFVSARVDKESPYLNEQIVCTFLFCRRVKVANASITDMPSFEDFMTEDLEKNKEYQKIINGRTYIVTEIKKALFPLKTGIREIAPFTLQCDVVMQNSRRRSSPFQDPFFSDPFFGFTETVPKTFRTAPLSVMVRPLPAEGRPDGFKNLVGTYSLNAAISKQKLSVGESATLTITLSGTGNLKGMQSLDLPGLQNFKVYDDKPVFKASANGDNIGGTLVIKKALVPITAGTLSIPPVTVSYFNPASGKYETASAGSFSMAVSPALEKENLTVVASPDAGLSSKKEVRVLGKDIMDIHTSLDALKSSSASPLSAAALILFFIPVAGYVMCFIRQKVNERRAGDSGIMRSRTAYRRFSKAMPAVKKAMSADDTSFHRLASKALKDFMGDKLNIAGGALTAKEVASLLEHTGLSPEAQAEAVRLVDVFDTSQFGFQKYTVEEKHAALKSMIKLAKAMDRKLKRRV